jgi:hypothetical protein
MHEASRVQEGQRRGDVTQQQTRGRRGQRRQIAQVLPLEELHRVVEARRIDAEIERLDDAWVPQGRERVKLSAKEQRPAFTVLAFGSEQLLERQCSLGWLVEDAVHGAHAAGSERRDHAVTTGDQRTRRQIARGIGPRRVRRFVDLDPLAVPGCHEATNTRGYAFPTSSPLQEAPRGSALSGSGRKISM